MSPFKFLLSVVVSCGIGMANAQETLLQGYIDEALSNNIALKQKNIALDKAMLALETAKSLYRPNLNLQAGYQHGDGGRSIDFPIGDLLNPVYSTLNRLTSSTAFPKLDNVSTTFLPQNFHDIKMVGNVPIYNRDLKYNKLIQEKQMDIRQVDIDLYSRELVKNVKTAYFQYLSALRAVDICEKTLKLAEEGKRTSEKLVTNGKGLPAYILRAEAEISQRKATLNDARKNSTDALMYFNFLLNRPLQTQADTSFNIEAYVADQGTALTKKTEREEQLLLRKTVEIGNTVTQLEKGFATPKLYGFLQLGTQSSTWKWNNKDAYYITGLQMDVPIFNGNRNRLKIKQAELDVKNQEHNLELVTRQLDLAKSEAERQVEAAKLNLDAAGKQLEAAASYQRLIERGFKEGVNTYIETLDALTQYTSAEQFANISLFRWLIALANLERENASYPISKK